MASELTRVPAYRHTMARLEEVKRVTPQGEDYWLARDINRLLGYPTWDKFLPVIQRARDALEANGVESSQHIAQTSKMVGVGSGAQRRSIEFFLSRAACYLIAMNGDPSKPEIAAAQAYFAIQTRHAELAQREAKDRKRLDTRERVAEALKRIGAVAKDVGVQRYGLFHDARYRGLYGASAKEVGKKKGLKPEETLLDRAAALELSAHEFQTTLATEKILNDGISGEAHAISANLEVAKDVRQLVIEKAGVKLEDLPLEPEPIQEVRKRLSVRARHHLEKPARR